MTSLLTELKRLHAGQRSDAEIAEELSLLFAPQSFYRQQVWRLRRQHGLKTWRRNPASLSADLLEARYRSWRLYQVNQGWLHLLPSELPDGHGWGPGHELSPREVDILTALSDAGEPMTGSQLTAALNLRHPDYIGGVGRGKHGLWLYRHSRGGPLPRLCRAGLVLAQVRSRRCGGVYALYSLTDAAGRRSLSRDERIAAGLAST